MEKKGEKGGKIEGKGEKNRTQNKNRKHLNGWIRGMESGAHYTHQRPVQLKNTMVSEEITGLLFSE